MRYKNQTNIGDIYEKRLYDWNFGIIAYNYVSP